MEEMTNPLLNFLLGGGLVAIIGFFTAKVTARAQKESAEVEARGPEWQAYVQEMKTWTTEQLKERDVLISKLEMEVREVREKLEVWKSRYYVAIHYIRTLLLAFPEALKKHPIPDELDQDF
ncbi:hypothetical protein HO100_11445 [Corynebacterium ulcerans]|uniref:Secreted protein n=1 Tax=Corynebacterium ulcerans FRC58 TaxID=1408268 RepID=A0ABN4H0N4_CORUL|nr:hypothetical protein [Corynebacterium ulcerans]AKN77509.1 Hypothetical protein CulFRC58_1655 [Corynebacterium ulcerans FRC58]ESU57165.1 hypothetical protein D881_10595 [Corynebacterium ulcerans NCTC 12077]MBH5303288.1 hypothetical protein [Corynebacterium ulcerans]NOL63374.1 hypothetical protein [Corynebacterium ulcerans]STC82375.1 Uncharacterised protein [Corynebacterium ulcerans]